MASAAWTERSRPVRTTKKLAQRSKRQNVTVLLAASVLGLWFGVVAPDVSPAAPPAAVAAAAGQPAPVQPAPAPVVVDPFPARGGRR